MTLRVENVHCTWVAVMDLVCVVPSLAIPACARSVVISVLVACICAACE